MHRPTFSLIVPTRHRPTQLRRFLDSVLETAASPEAIEVVLVIDADDAESMAVRHELDLKRVIGPPGRTMGTLNTEGYEASRGAYVMLLNDDVVARTRGWDATALAWLRRFPDGIVLVHVNDTLIQEHLCTFPLVSRAFCELAGGICPREYVRYRIDDHIEDVFNLLAFLGRRRKVYLPDVVFEHLNAVEHPQAGRVYQSAADLLAVDAPRFEALFPERKELALRLLDYMEGPLSPEALAAHRRELEGVRDPFALRVPGRQWVERAAWWRRAARQARRSQDLAVWANELLERARGCVQRKGYRGLAGAVGRRLGRLVTGPPRGGLR